MEFQKTEIPTTENHLKVIAKRFSWMQIRPGYSIMPGLIFLVWINILDT